MAITRRATSSDVERLTALTVIMHDTLTGPHTRGPWVAACEAAFIDRFDNDPDFVAFVAEADDAGVVSFVAGETRRRFPGPGSITPIFGYAAIGGTHPHYRRKGYMRACLLATLDYFVEQGCERVSIFSGADAESLHRSLGFERHEGWPVPMNWYAP